MPRRLLGLLVMPSRAVGFVALILLGCSASKSEAASTKDASPERNGSTDCQVNGGQILVSVSPNPAAGGIDAQLDTTGAITATDSKQLTIDTCAPSADCVPSPVKFSVDAQGLALDIPVGAFVRVRYAAKSYGSGHAQTLLSVRNLADWDGTANPVAADERWYLLTAEGSLAHPDAPFAVESLAIACPPPPEASGKSYRMLVGDGVGGAQTTLAQGETASIELAGQAWKLGLVRAFEPYGYDYAAPFAWWAKGQP